MKFWDDINKAVVANNKKTQNMSEKALRKDWKRKQKQRGNPKVTVEEVRTLGQHQMSEAEAWLDINCDI